MSRLYLILLAFHSKLFVYWRGIIHSKTAVNQAVGKFFFMARGVFSFRFHKLLQHQRLMGRSGLSGAKKVQPIRAGKSGQPKISSIRFRCPKVEVCFRILQTIFLNILKSKNMHTGNAQTAS